MTKFGVSTCWIQPHLLPNLTMFSGCTRLLQRHGQGRYCHGDLVTMLHVWWWNPTCSGLNNINPKFLLVKLFNRVKPQCFLAKSHVSYVLITSCWVKPHIFTRNWEIFGTRAGWNHLWRASMRRRIHPKINQNHHKLTPCLWYKPSNYGGWMVLPCFTIIPDAAPAHHTSSRWFAGQDEFASVRMHIFSRKKNGASWWSLDSMEIIWKDFGEVPTIEILRIHVTLICDLNESPVIWSLKQHEWWSYLRYSDISHNWIGYQEILQETPHRKHVVVKTMPARSHVPRNQS